MPRRRRSDSTPRLGVATHEPVRFFASLRVAFVLIAVGLAPPAAPRPLRWIPEVTVASGLAAPTAMQFAPDGRLFICEQTGRLRVVKNGSLLPTPFVTVTSTPMASEVCSAWHSIQILRAIISSSLLHGDDASCTQSHQPVHCER
jgi:hypothetical protein